MNGLIFRRAAVLSCFLTGPAMADAPLTVVFTGPGTGLQAPCLPYTQVATSPLPFSPFSGGRETGTRVAAGDVNGDGTLDILVGSGPASDGRGTVSIVDGTSNASLATIDLPGTNYRAGVWPSSADVNGDGRADIVAGAGTGSEVRIYDGTNSQLIRTFDAYPAAFTGGVRTAAADVNGDGKADIITGAGAGGGPHVKVFNGATGAELASFLAYDPAFTGGVFVSAGILDSDNKPDILVSPGPNTTGLPLKGYAGPAFTESQSYLLSPSPDPAFTAIGGNAGTGAQQVHLLKDGKMFVLDWLTKQAIRTVSHSLVLTGPKPAPFAVANVTGDAKPEVIGGSDSLPLVRKTTLDFAKRFAFDKYPEGPTFRGGINVAAGDLNGDGVFDMIMAPASAGSGSIKTCTGTDGNLIDDFLPFTPPPPYPLNVASGDVNGDGKDDVIVAAGNGGGPQVKVIESGSLNPLFSFFAYAPTFTGGVNVASADVNADGKDDIITGAGSGGSQVKVFSGVDLKPLYDFLSEAAGFTGGVYVAAGDVNGDGRADIVTGAGTGGQNIRVFDGATGAPIGAFFPYEGGFAGGVRVAVGDVDGDSKPEILCSPGPGRVSEVRGFSFPALEQVFSFQPYAATFTGGCSVSTWTPAPASILQTSARRNAAGKMEMTLQAPTGRTLYVDFSTDLLNWKQATSRPGTGLPSLFEADPSAAPQFYVRGRVQ
jgi:hypothetical protein